MLIYIPKKDGPLFLVWLNKVGESVFRAMQGIILISQRVQNYYLMNKWVTKFNTERLKQHVMKFVMYLQWDIVKLTNV